MSISPAHRFRSLACLLAVLSTSSAALSAPDEPVDPKLTATIAALDAEVFNAYNRCDLKTFERYFSPDVEFYHDKSGVTWDRATVVANTKKWICGQVRRELIPGSLRIYPIKGYGAIEEGEHRFCQLPGGECDGIAKFLMIWRVRGARWEMTRVVSYGHRENTVK